MEELLFEVLNNNSGGDNTIDGGSLCRSALCSNFLLGLGLGLCIIRVRVLGEQITIRIANSSFLWMSAFVVIKLIIVCCVS